MGHQASEFDVVGPGEGVKREEVRMKKADPVSDVVQGMGRRGL
jgi:hypothetical protein